MTQLMRCNFKRLFERSNQIHVGLLIQRGYSNWASAATPKSEDKQNQTDCSKKSLSEKRDLIRRITQVQVPELYRLAYLRWLNLTSQVSDSTTDPQFVSLVAAIDGRLMSELGSGGTLETGAPIQHSYAMPKIAGSAVKGAVRSYWQTLLLQQLEAQLSPEEREQHLQVMQILFGAEHGAIPTKAQLIWHDAWWVPTLKPDGTLLNAESSNAVAGPKNRPFMTDIVTVHHPAYYAGQKDFTEAWDIESPVPNYQLAVSGGFYFVIENNGLDSTWLDFAKQLLQQTIEQIGLGAKTAAGYGYFKADVNLEKNVKKHYMQTLETIRQAKKQSGVGANTTYDDLQAFIKSSDESSLIESLSRGRTKFFENYDLDFSNVEHKRIVAEIVRQYQPEWLNQWQQSKAKNTVKARDWINACLAAEN